MVRVLRFVKVSAVLYLILQKRCTACSILDIFIAAVRFEVSASLVLFTWKSS